jgi:hypothetical protein
VVVVATVVEDLRHVLDEVAEADVVAVQDLVVDGLEIWLGEKVEKWREDMKEWEGNF